jgi:glucose-6-phosphate isomerase
MMFYQEPVKIELKGSDLYVNGHKHECSIRKLQKMTDVLYSKVTPMSEEDFNLYFMYRSVYSTIEMRFDITYIPAKKLGTEFNKTYGHYHPISESGLAYPEVYQVLSGKALFVLQKKVKDGGVEVLILDAEEGDVVLMPPNYGHVTINPTQDQPLVLSNIVFNGFESDYSEYEQNHGAAYYFTDDGLVQNTNYLVKKFTRLKASELANSFNFSSKDLLREFVKDPEKFRFLEKPSVLFK